MHTGDLATIDAEGYCNIVGRVKDMLIRGGENVYPREIEEFLLRHPKVQAAQVFGVPDPQLRRGGLRLDRAEAGRSRRARRRSRAFCQGQIAHYKVPRHVRFVPDVPAHRHRQAAEVRDARSDDARARR